MDEAKREALRQFLRDHVSDLAGDSTSGVGGGDTGDMADALTAILSEHLQSEGEAGSEMLERLLNPDPRESMAQETLAVSACRRARPQVCTALEGVATVKHPYRYSMRMSLCLPEGAEGRGVSLSYVPMLEMGEGKGPGSKMVETALLGPDGDILYTDECGYGSGVIQHPSLDVCLGHITQLRQYYLLMSEGEDEAAKAISDAEADRQEEMYMARYEARRARREAEGVRE
ncbi:hypothetical protein KIPB_000141 [Kipferlia bialata]|uniref:Uncharacterized protein n=1 Tax=Kipferlia bialata TaxID=797122 RepID=A0A9K3CNR1_9EUKA|nr:hypothetical protein KIPB_000141 [Kipferlia bialata]|eukprot:g141.t1